MKLNEIINCTKADGSSLMSNNEMEWKP